jgi:hypothetical protein
MLNGNPFQFFGRRKGCGDAVGARDFDGRVGAEAEQNTQLGARGVALCFEFDQVLVQASEGHLRAEDITLRSFAGGVFGQAGGDGLIENSDLLVVHAHLVGVAQQSGAGFANAGRDVLAECFHVVG